jgi:hypothetical protein
VGYPDFRLTQGGSIRKIKDECSVETATVYKVLRADQDQGASDCYDQGVTKSRRDQRSQDPLHTHFKV